MNDWKGAIQHWRALTPAQQRQIRRRRLPRKVARSMAFEGEPVDQRILEQELIRLTQQCNVQRLASREGGIMDSENKFKELTGFEPMKWQTRLYHDYFAEGRIPASLDIPTGLGKTSVMAIWYLARKAGAALPRRLVYVVDRRAVVDQATTVANQIKERSGDADLRISTLRGQYTDNREWLEDPGKPAIIVGTVDMIGSRLLFSGYGVSRKTRSYHAGLLGADTLVVLDESHLVPPFEQLLETIAIESGTQGSLGPMDSKDRKIVPPFKLLSLSATGHEHAGERFHLDESKGDLDDEVAKERLGAIKRLTMDNGSNKTTPDEQRRQKNKQNVPKLEEELAKHAWALSRNGVNPVRILVYCNSRDVAEKTKQSIETTAKKAKIAIDTELFTGARRVCERLKAAARLEQLGFLANGDAALDRPAFLVATSAGEVGVDLDADHMVCDLVEWERMVQRFGRVNRTGGQGRYAEIYVVGVEPEKPNITKTEPPPSEPPKEPEKPSRLPRNASDQERVAHTEKKKRHEGDLKSYKDEKKKFDKAVKDYPEKQRKYEEAWKDVWAFTAKRDAVELLTNDASPGNLRQIKLQAETDSHIQQKLNAASTPPPLYPTLPRALVDAWSMTSLDIHTGRPEVGPWLRGWIDDVPQTTVLWRKYLPVRIQGEESPKKEIEAFFNTAPPHLSEKLETETWRVLDWLGKSTAAFVKQHKECADSIVAFALDTNGTLRKSLKAVQLVPDADKEREKKRKEVIEKALTSATLIVDQRLGGLSDDGLLKADADADGLRTADDGDDWSADVGFRIFIATSDEALDKTSRVTFLFATRQSSEGEDIDRLLIETTKTENSRAASSHAQLLEEHQSWAEDRARRIATALGLTGNHAEVVAIAARLHDEGKKASRWQRAFNAKGDGIYAKTKGPLVLARLGGYRHEFGSLPYAENDARLQKLPTDLQDLVLHLIAAHHGRARPIIGTEGCEDAPSVLETRARDVALRFAQLQKQWGPWGLAWWEALLRAADQQASRGNDNRGNAHG